MRTRLRGGLPVLVLAALIGGAFVAFLKADNNPRPAPDSGAVRIGVLGDSDSRGYNDSIRGIHRGGAFHHVTYQWTDVLAALRGDYVDMGPLETAGTFGRIASLRVRFGLEAKTPRKFDYRYNYALSGARCNSLVSEWPRQARWLASAIRDDPKRWANGVVIIRIGVNDLGQKRHLEEYADRGVTAESRATLDACARSIAQAAEIVRSANSTTRIVVVGIADDSSWPPAAMPWRSPTETARIREVLDLFDEKVRSRIERLEHAVFMADRKWYYEHWADRDSVGHAQFSARSLGGPTPVSNTQGDEPYNLVLADGHAGTVANGFWVRELIHTLNTEFGTGIPPLLDAEIARLADPSGEFGIAPPLPDQPLAPTIDLSFDRLTVSLDDLPFRLPPFTARDSEGHDITDSATATIQRAGALALPLFGDGSRLELRAGRHSRGLYRLDIRVRDGQGRAAAAGVPLAIQ